MPEIKERPILFSAPMVRAILESRKTVTRREVKKRAALDCLAAGFEPAFLTLAGNADLCPYGKPGERLWVRESFWHAGDWISTYPEDDTGSWSGTRRVHYRADGEPPNEPNRNYPKGLSTALTPPQRQRISGAHVRRSTCRAGPAASCWRSPTSGSSGCGTVMERRHSKVATSPKV